MKNNIFYKLRIALASIFFIMAIAAATGIFYKIPIFSVQFLPLTEKVFVDFSIISLIMLIVILTLTSIFGRFYCSTICPLGFLQEICTLIFKRNNVYQKKSPLKYFFSAIFWGTFVGGTTMALRYFEPYTIFTSAITLTTIGCISIFLIVVLSCVKSRFFCTNICPIGTLLGLLSRFSYYKMNINQEICKSCGICEKNCPAECINSQEKNLDDENCIKCLNCLSTCPKGGVTYSHKKNVKFSAKRRDLVIATVILGTLTVAYKAGIQLRENLSEKIRNVILPPGAKNEEHLLNKCLNCNLCVTNCPNKIIKKADKNFEAIHINFEEGYCDYNCKRCSEVCPTGAIKKLSIEEKQKTQIAVATINNKKCLNCNLCKNVCPVNAIKVENKEISIDSGICIGCGVCKASCPTDAFELSAVNIQN